MSTMLNGAKPTLIYDGKVMDAAQLERVVHGFAAALHALGLRRDDRLALWLPNCPAWLIAHLAACQLGVMTMAVNTRFRSAEVEDVLARSGASALLYWPGFLGIDFDAILADIEVDALASLRHIVVYREDGKPVPRQVSGRPAHDYHDLVRFDALAIAPEPRADDGCILFTTSGTTGVPKLALHARASIADHADIVAPAFGYADPDTTLLQALPLCGTFGHAQAMAGLRAGARLVLMSAFSLERALDLIRDYRVTRLNGADSMFEDMWASGRAGDLASVLGGGFAAFVTPDPEDFASRAEQHGLEMFGLYGMSEVQALFSRQAPGSPVEKRAHGGGRPVAPAAAFRICDPDTGALMPVRTAGELQLKGPSMMREYFGNPEATAGALTADGFLRTGDLAHDEGDGRFRYLARMGDSLRLGGFIASPAEIEAYIDRHPSVETSQVVGVDSSRGTVPVAFVLPARDAAFDADALAAHSAHGLARYKVPVRFVAVTSFPTTPSPNGEKIQRVKLREMAAELLRERSD
ncbi:MAG: AMP-binding protein [Pseudomonadota bacterium]